ncbi:MAG: zinc-ribbon domain-containing protein [Clostridia bacterium]|nr:zinc-ribbon domain-containing protein [Clostridia bacterium]
MFCGNCGKEITENTVFCPNCGHRIEKDNRNDVEANKDKLVKLIVHRKKSLYGAAVSTKVHVDGNLAASLKSDGTAEINVTPGNHEVIFDMWSATEKTNIEIPSDCTAVYVEIGLKMGLITNKIRILSIRNEK